MKRLVFVRAFLAFLLLMPSLFAGLSLSTLADEASASVSSSRTPLTLAEVLGNPNFSATLLGDGQRQLTLTVRNPASQKMAITIPAGLIFANETDTARLLILRTCAMEIRAEKTFEISLPVVALHPRDALSKSRFHPIVETESRLQPLLKYVADQPDFPRETAQLAVFCILENSGFSEWQKYCARALSGTSTSGTESSPAPAAAPPAPSALAITQAVDVLGLLRVLFPARTFALAADQDLKARALRTPACRGKAMAIYGLDLGDGAPPPSLGQLLHTRPGDNCPICRQRAQMEKAASDL